MLLTSSSRHGSLRRAQGRLLDIKASTVVLSPPQLSQAPAPPQIRCCSAPSVRRLPSLLAPELTKMPSMSSDAPGDERLLKEGLAPPVAVQRDFLDMAGVGVPAIGGHRGMGANVIRGGALAPAWRENTLRSFQAAAASGASFVEFDVQVTVDGVPVVWHDDTVEFGDPSRPSQVAVAELTAAEFQALGALSASGKCQQLSVVRRFKHAAASAAAAQSPEARLAAALASAGADEGDGSSAAAAGAGAASQRRRWCCEVDDAFPTLEQLFSALPGHLAFNIEVKMATPAEVAITPAAEIQRMVGPILAVVARCTGAGAPGAGRQVVFSSFDPDVCAALRQGQGDHQVLFLSTGGRDWHADARRMSLAAAVEEAAASQLSGVVVDSGALHAAPEVVAQARAAGLKLLTYGLENDTLAWVLQQQQLGVTGVIVDDLEGLMSALRSGGGGAAVPAAAVAQADAAAAAAAAAATTAAVVEGLVGQVAVQAVSSAVSQAQAAAPLLPAVVAT